MLAAEKERRVAAVGLGLFCIILHSDSNALYKEQTVSVLQAKVCSLMGDARDCIHGRVL